MLVKFRRCLIIFYQFCLKKLMFPEQKLLKEPAECLADELQRWLECHGQKKKWQETSVG